MFIGHFRYQTGIANWPWVYFDNEGGGDGVTRGVLLVLGHCDRGDVSNERK